MNSQRIGGIIMLVAGVALFIVGMNASDSVADQFSDLFTGHFTNATVMYIVGGAALAVAGLVMVGAGGLRRWR